jgi:eukaryotic-like serine/threonine-protein kinase
LEEVSEEDAEMLLEGLLRYRDDQDLIQEAIMSVNVDAFRIMEQLDVNGLRSVVSLYSEIMRSQGWPFNFTDDIGKTCLNIFRVVTDFEIRADLIHCAVEVGTSHNRFYVMDIAARLISEKKEPGEAIPFRERLEKVPMPHLRTLKNYIENVGRLDPLLKPLFK